MCVSARVRACVHACVRSRVHAGAVKDRLSSVIHFKLRLCIVVMVHV